MLLDCVNTMKDDGEQVVAGLETLKNRRVRLLSGA